MGSYISSAVNYYTPGQQSATPESHPAVTSQMSNPNKIDDKVDIDASMQPPTAKRPCLDTDNKTNNDAVGITMPVSSVHQNDNTTPEPPDRRGRWSFEGWIETWITYSSYGWFVSDTINFYDCTLKRTVVPGLLESGHDCSTIVVNLQRGYAQFIHADSQKVGHLRRTTVPFTLTIDAPLAIKKDDAGVVSKEQSALASESSSAFSAVHEAAAFARANGHVWIADIAQWASNEMDATSSKRIVFHDCQLTCTWVPSILEEYMCVDRIAICSPEQCLPSLSYIEVECFKKDLLSRIQIRWFWFPEQYSSHVDEFVPPDFTAEHYDGDDSVQKEVDKTMMENTITQHAVEEASSNGAAPESIEISEDEPLRNQHGTNDVLHSLDALESAASLDELSRSPAASASRSQRHQERKLSRRAKRKRGRGA